MNQRPGKTHAAALGDRVSIDYKKLVTFLEGASKDLEDAGQTDAAFYFEQVRDWLVNDWTPSKPFEYRSLILGL